MPARLARMLCLTTALALAAPAAGAQIAVGARAPSAQVETLDGTSLDLASLYGQKPVVLEFWATWCPICKELEPVMRQAAKLAGDRATFVAVGVSVNQNPARIKAWQEKHAMPMRFVFDRKGNATGAYDVFATSTVVVVDSTGTVVYVGQGGDQDLKAALGKAGIR